MFQIKTFCKSTITRLAWTLRQLAKPMAYELPFVLFFVMVNCYQSVHRVMLITYAMCTGNYYTGGGIPLMWALSSLICWPSFAIL